VVVQVPEEEPGVLTYLSGLGLRPGTVVVVVAIAPFEGPLTLRVGEAVLALGRNLASRILVERK
jgi:DtxR family Mn-dependent transcriptional regulator